MGHYLILKKDLRRIKFYLSGNICRELTGIITLKEKQEL